MSASPRSSQIPVSLTKVPTRWPYVLWKAGDIVMYM